MNLNPVITQLRTYCPSFAGRVAGSARFKRLDETANMALPAAYVIPLDDSPGERMSLNDMRQSLVESFAVIVAISNTPDERGQAAINTAHDSIRSELWGALLGWQPDNLHEHSIYRGIEYQGGNLLDLDRSRLWYQFDFGAYMEISQDQGWQGTELANLSHFDGLNITLENDIDISLLSYAISGYWDNTYSQIASDPENYFIQTIPKTGNLPI